ncbi:hypothetical protein WA538_003026, partial [Blastocystis sp. DL]
MGVVNGVVVPLLDQSAYVRDCLGYVGAMVRHPFSKENRSIVKELVPFLLQIHRLLFSRSISSDNSVFIDEFDFILIAFLQTQMKSFFPIRSDAEMTLYSQLFVLLNDCVRLSSLKMVIELLGVVHTLLPRDQDEQTGVVIREHCNSLLSTLCDAYSEFTNTTVPHIQFITMEAESSSQYSRELNQLKLSIKKCAEDIATVVVNVVISFILTNLHPPIDPPHELALLLIFKGLMEFIRPSSRSSSISQDNLHSLFVTLREYLFFGRCSCRVEALQILSVLSSVATLTLEESTSVLEPLMYTLGNRALSSDPAMENEISKCMKSLLASQRSSLASLAPQLCPAFAQLLQVGLPDVPRGTVIQCFVLLTMPSPTARDDLYSALSYLLSPLQCLPPFSDSLSFISFFTANSGELARVTSALSDVTELLSSVSSLELRLQLSQRTCETYNLLPLTVGLLLTMQPREWNPNEELWNACTLKELGNQRSQRVFPLSEKIYYLFKMVMRCWKEFLLNENNISESRLNELQWVLHEYLPSLRALLAQDILLSIVVPVYLSFPPSLPQSLLVSFLSSTFTSLFLLLSNFSMLPSLRYYQLDSEHNDVINTNNFTSLLSTVTTVFHYLVGFTMRDMSLSLMNRPFLREYSESQEEGESRCVDTQALIDRRVNIMKQRFHNVIILADASLNETVMRILLFILQSGTLLPVQNLFAFLLEYLKLFEQADGDFVHSVFSTVLKLYMTTHGDRCKEVTQISLLILSTVYRNPTVQRDGTVISFDLLIMEMQTILHWTKGSLAPAVYEILNSQVEKNQILAFRKILEGARRSVQEKGVPLHLPFS